MYIHSGQWLGTNTEYCFLKDTNITKHYDTLVFRYTSLWLIFVNLCHFERKLIRMPDKIASQKEEGLNQDYQNDNLDQSYLFKWYSSTWTYRSQIKSK